MTLALRVWNSSGKKQLDTSSRVARLITSFVTNINSGVTLTTPVTGMTTDGTWYIITSDQFIESNILSGSFTLKNNTIMNLTNIQVSIYRL